MQRNCVLENCFSLTNLTHYKTNASILFMHENTCAKHLKRTFCNDLKVEIIPVLINNRMDKHSTGIQEYTTHNGTQFDN
jgi:hypothetical protein